MYMASVSLQRLPRVRGWPRLLPPHPTSKQQSRPRPPKKNGSIGDTILLALTKAVPLVVSVPNTLLGFQLQLLGITKMDWLGKSCTQTLPKSLTSFPHFPYVVDNVSGTSFSLNGILGGPVPTGQSVSSTWTFGTIRSFTESA